MRLLLVEDEKNLADITTRRLTEEGYTVENVFNGEDASQFIESGSYDCIILDIMLPEKDGLSVLRTMRGKSNSTPVLLLTAKDSVSDRVKGLDAGADDYLVKPFSYDELSARVRAMLRRGSDNKSLILKCADLTMDTLTREVKRSGKPIELAAKEYALLEYLMRNQKRVLTRGQITEHVWRYDFGVSNVVDVYIRYLRRKIDYDFEPKLIHTVRGVGYVMKVE